MSNRNTRSSSRKISKLRRSNRSSSNRNKKNNNQSSLNKRQQFPKNGIRINSSRQTQSISQSNETIQIRRSRVSTHKKQLEQNNTKQHKKSKNSESEEEDEEQEEDYDNDSEEDDELFEVVLNSNKNQEENEEDIEVIQLQIPQSQPQSESKQNLNIYNSTQGTVSPFSVKYLQLKVTFTTYVRSIQAGNLKEESQRQDILLYLSHSTIPTTMIEEWESVLEKESLDFRRSIRQIQQQTIKPSSKRKKGDSEKEHLQDFWQMPDLKEEGWPKYVGTFQASSAFATNHVIKQIGYKRCFQTVNLFKGHSFVGMPLKLCSPYFSVNRGKKKGIRVDIGSVASFVECDSLNFVVGEINHYLNEIWSFLMYKNMVILKPYLASSREQMSADPFINTPDRHGSFDILVDVFLNKEFFENKQDNLDFDEDNEIDYDGEEEEEEEKDDSQINEQSRRSSQSCQNSKNSLTSQSQERPSGSCQNSKNSFSTQQVKRLSEQKEDSKNSFETQQIQGSQFLKLPKIESLMPIKNEQNLLNQSEDVEQPTKVGKRNSSLNPTKKIETGKQKKSLETNQEKENQEEGYFEIPVDSVKGKKRESSQENSNDISSLRQSTESNENRPSGVSVKEGEKKKRPHFRDLSKPEKERIWEEGFKRHLKEVILLFTGFMHLKVTTPALIRQKKKNQFKLMTIMIERSYKSQFNQAKIIIKSNHMNKYYGESSAFLNKNNQCVKLFQRVNKLIDEGISEDNIPSLLTFQKNYKIIKTNNQWQEEPHQEENKQQDDLIETIPSNREQRTALTNREQLANYVEQPNTTGNKIKKAEDFNEQFSKLHESKYYTQTATPSTMCSQLFDYQKQGLSWLLYREGKISKKQLFIDHPEVFQEDRDLNPFYEEIVLPDGYTFYLNVLSGSISTSFVKAKHTFGGILADQMGLGKTLMSLALIHTDLKEKRKDGEYGTLIVLPLPVLSQWRKQIDLHSDAKVLDVLNYHEKQKRDSDLSKYDIVLCPYNLLGFEFEKNKNGPLFSQKWNRVILDEAQKIKNRASSIAKGAFRLQANYRWCLTGTPIENKLDDIFSLLHFLKMETFGEWIWWNSYINGSEKISEETEDQFELLHQVISPIILRRTKASTDKTGKDILVLPPKYQHNIEIDLSPCERRLYDLIHKSSESIFKRLNDSNQIKDNYIHVFQIICKLRMFCVHPSLVFADIDDEKLNNLDSFKDKIDAFIRKQESNFKDKTNMQQDQSLDKYKEEVIKQIKQGEYQTCQVCLEEIDSHSISTCLHVLCTPCFKKSVQARGNCPLCRKNLSLYDLMEIDPELIANEQVNLDQYKNIKKLSGSKMKKVIELIEAIKEKNEKVVVFSQWLGAMNILEQILQDRKIKYQRFDGGVNQKDKERVLARFEKQRDGIEDNVTVLLASIKSAYVGLNLVAANNVILCDSWWNPAVEDQAIERVHRIGQEKEVNVWRVICKKTIEERVIQLHEQKRKLINNALSCTESGRQEKAIQELKFLFQ